MRDSLTSSRKLTIGVLNIMPSESRVATENMFKRRFEGFDLPYEIVWLNPEANDSGFSDTEETYHVPNPEIYDRIDYLFRSGADAEFIDPAKNRFLQCLRESRAFTKGSTSLCWSAGQIYADDTGQEFSNLLIGDDEDGNHIKRSGYLRYQMFLNMGIQNIPDLDDVHMACSRHFAVHAVYQREKIEKGKFQKIAISKGGSAEEVYDRCAYDIAGLKKGNDILLFTHNEYDPERLHIETNRDIERAKKEKQGKQETSLRAKFPNFRSYEQVADKFGYELFQAILWDAAKRKYQQPAPSLEVQGMRLHA